MLSPSISTHVANLGINDIYTFQSKDNTLNFIDYYRIIDIKSIIEYPITQLSKSISNNNQSSTSNNQSSSFINDVLDNRIVESNRSIDITSITEDINEPIASDNRTNFPLFFNHKNTIKVPTKVDYALRRYTPKHLLRNIHPEIDVAVEMCLLFTTQLTSTYFEMLDDSASEGWKALKAEYLRDFLSNSSLTYKNVRQALEYPLENGAILQCDHISAEGSKSFNYRIGDAYIKKGLVGYELKTAEAIGLLNKRYMRTYGSALDNLICKNLIEFYSNLTLPTIDQIKTEAKRLIKIGHKNRKGKKLKSLNNHTKSYFKNPEKLSFVEDSIEIYKYLTDNGLMIPKTGTDASGGRVVDSFTLMPSWIRKMVKVGGKTPDECDYSCLHPNIAIALYGGKQEYISHEQLALASGIDADTVKIEHLSFFNKKVWQMKQSPLYSYYMKNEPLMMENIITEKYRSEFKYWITSRRMFQTEVAVMTDVIELLNQEGIYVGYVYDALFCHPKHADRVKQVMDEIILKHGIKTTAKLSTGKRDKSILEASQDKLFDLISLKSTESISTDTIHVGTEILKADIAISTITHGEQLNLKAGELSFSDNIKNSVLELMSAGTTLNFADAIITFDDGISYEDKVTVYEDPYCRNCKYLTYSFINGTEPKRIGSDGNINLRKRA